MAGRRADDDGRRVLPALGRARTTATCKPGQRAAYTIQTNGTLLDEEWAAFFKEHDFLVGVSIDGPRELHDAYRVNKGGRGSFDQVMRRARAPARGGRRVERAHDRACRETPTSGREVYRFLRDECGARFVQFIPIIERVAEADADGTVPWTSWRDRPLYVQEGERVTGRSVTAEQYGRFLIDVFEEWVRRDIGEVYVQMFDVALANWVGEPPSLCVHSETCGLALALEHTGDVYSCDHFVEPATSSATSASGTCSSWSPPSSSAGSASTSASRSRATASSATCASPVTAAARRTGSSRRPTAIPGLNYLCSGFKAFFHHVDRPMKIMGRLLAADRAPSEIMALYATEDARRGRNDPCTCGSGRKWKQCHGALRDPRPSALAE